MDPENSTQTVAHATVRSFVEGVRGESGRAEVLGLVGSGGAHLLAGLLDASD
ncbi:hypothetical protein [Desulfuromonas sp.]|nr:hypothetical protein [Desulfuromonas sp.]